MRKFLALGLAVLVVLALWSAGWMWAAGEVKRQVLVLAEADGEASPKLTCGTLNVTGYPFRFDLECGDATLVDKDITLTLAGLKATVLAYSPTHVVFSAQSPLGLANAFTGSQSRVEFTGFAGSARVKTDDILKALSGEGWRIARVSAVADGVVWNETVLGDMLQLRAGHVEAHLVDIPEQHDKTTGRAGMAAYAQVKEVDVPALKITSGNATLEAEISGMPDDLRAYSDPDFLRSWQQRDGKLNLARFDGSQPDPDENFDLTGTFSLTPAGLVKGQLTYRTKGVLDRLTGILPPLALAGLRGKPEADGSFSNTLSIADGKLRLLALPLGDIPPLF